MKISCVWWWRVSKSKENTQVMPSWWEDIVRQQEKTFGKRKEIIVIITGTSSSHDVYITFLCTLIYEKQTNRQKVKYEEINILAEEKVVSLAAFYFLSAFHYIFFSWDGCWSAYTFWICAISHLSSQSCSTSSPRHFFLFFFTPTTTRNNNEAFLATYISHKT